MKTFSRAPMLIGLGLMLALFNLVVFLLPVDRSNAFWAAYIFATVAFLLQIVYFELSFGDAKNLKHIFFGYPVAYLGTIYLVLQLIFSAVVMISEALEVQTTVIVSAILLAGSLMLLAAAVFSRAEITTTEDKVKAKRQYIDFLYTDLESLQARAAAPEAKAVLKKLAEAVRYSDPMSAPELVALENEIIAKAGGLKPLVEASNLEALKKASEEITALLAERNAKCKIMK